MENYEEISPQRGDKLKMKNVKCKIYHRGYREHREEI